MRRTLAVTIAALALTTAPTSARVPSNFFGVQADGPLLQQGFDATPEFDLMSASGVQTIRIGMPWVAIEPAPGDLRFEETDRVIAQAAAHGLDVLPVVTFAPDWAARHPGNSNSPPAGTANYANFIAACVRRYGPSGSFWAEHPELPQRPIRSWQVWNEPNQPVFNWSDQPFARDYVALLRAARAAIKAIDPGAQIVQAGLVGTSWSALAKIYKAGGKGLFDAVAIHPFTLQPKNTLVILNRVREVMKRNGDTKKPIFVTELTWPAAKGQRLTRTYGYEVTDAQQAQKLNQVLPALVKQRKALHLARVYWYTWISSAPDPLNDPFSYSGLRQLQPTGQIQPRPALQVYSRNAHRYE